MSWMTKPFNEILSAGHFAKSLSKQVYSYGKFAAVGRSPDLIAGLGRRMNLMKNTVKNYFMSGSTASGLGRAPNWGRIGAWGGGAAAMGVWGLSGDSQRR